MKNLRLLNALGVIVICLLVLFICISVFMFIKYNKLNSDFKKLTSIEGLSLTERVSRLVFLPENEEPRIITIINEEEIVNEPFFKNAKVGDSVLVYINARKAFIYRNSENKIVEIAPIIIKETASFSPDKTIDNPTNDI
ncbi:MAG: hypothetical protein CEO12_527 [Parcubacteria group bacterium Gr01-1014_46]|nr:MAG: hypothetical protein CEO12_527 [Parcubacteria group bacterium Gr01-1014_46]